MKRKRPPALGPSVTEKMTIEELDALMPPVPDDDPIYDRGFVFGQTFASASPNEAKKMNAEMAAKAGKAAPTRGGEELPKSSFGRKRRKK